MPITTQTQLSMISENLNMSRNFRPVKHWRRETLLGPEGLNFVAVWVGRGLWDSHLHNTPYNFVIYLVDSLYIYQDFVEAI